MDNILRVTCFSAGYVIYVLRRHLPDDMIMHVFTYIEDGIDYLVAKRYPQILDSCLCVDKNVLSILAFKHGWVELIKQRRLRGNKCAHILAIANDHVEAYNFILSYGVDLGCSAYEIALRNRSFKILLSTKRHNGYEDTLAYYVKRGDVEAAKIFKKHMQPFAKLSEHDKYWRKRVECELVDISFDMMKVVWNMYEFTPNMFIDRPHILAFLASKSVLPQPVDIEQVAMLVRFTKQHTIHYAGDDHKTLKTLAKTYHNIKWWYTLAFKYAKHFIQPSDVTLEMLHEAIKSGLYKYARLYLKFVRPTTDTIQLTRTSTKYNKLIRAVKAAALR